jgi:hypothetical protein
VYGFEVLVPFHRWVSRAGMVEMTVHAIYRMWTPLIKDTSTKQILYHIALIQVAYTDCRSVQMV